MRDSGDSQLRHSRRCAFCGDPYPAKAGGRGLCQPCYNRHYHAGTLPPPIRRPTWTLDPITGCWLWHKYRPDGYARIRRGTADYAHRYYYKTYVGPIPDGMELDHLCRVRHCVNPRHLEPVTPKVNTLRGLSPAAQFARATHCVNGHPFDEANTYVNARQRVCRTCARANSYRAYLVRKARKARAA
jgi:hypothetical protein